MVWQSGALGFLPRCCFLRWIILAMVVAFGPVGSRAEEPLPTQPMPSEGVLAIQRALAKPIVVDYADMPLIDAVADLKTESGIEIRIDPKISDAGIEPDALVNLSVKGVTLKSALRHMLSPLGLKYAIKDEWLIITTPEELETPKYMSPPRICSVGDLVAKQDEHGRPIDDFDSLIEVIETAVAPTSWESAGGPGAIAQFSAKGLKVLVIVQTQEVHEAVEALLHDLRTTRDRTAQPASTTETSSDAQEPLGGVASSDTTDAPFIQLDATAREEAIRKALDQEITVDFKDLTFEDVAAELQTTLKVPVQIDFPRLSNAGIDLFAGVTLRLADVPARKVLDALLRAKGLAWGVCDEAVRITTADAMADDRVFRVYDVADLASDGPSQEQLAEQIIRATDKTSWELHGGSGTIEPFTAPGIRSLIVAHTWRMHEDIATLLADLRKIRHGAPPGPVGMEPPLFETGLPASGGHGGGLVPRQDEARAPVVPDAQRNAVVRAANQFGIDLYGKLAARTKDNLFFSPVSITTALAMAYAGARGETADEMAKTLHWTLPQEAVAPAFGALRAALPLGDWPGREFHIANRLWGQYGYGFSEAFLDITRQHFGAELQELDFAQAESARQTINLWIAKETSQQIKDLVPPTMIDPAVTRLVLTNAAYFKGRWLSQFPKEDTKATAFYTGNRHYFTPTMHQVGIFAWRETQKLQVLEMPYAGQDLVMLILLPKAEPGALAKLETSLSAENIQKWLPGRKRDSVEVFLPRFKIETTRELPAALSELGMSRAFQAEAADFSGMNDGKEPLYLNAMIHKAFVSVDEEGTEAAAGTAGEMGGGPPPAPVFRADHPFIFLIRDKRTGCILFIGRLTQPESCEAPAEESGESGGASDRGRHMGEGMF